MQLVMFSKMLKEKSVDELVEIALDLGIDGYDLAVRTDYAVNPDNCSKALPDAVKRFEAAGLSIPMVTANGDLLMPDHATAEPLLGAMDAADVRRLKLGYFKLDPTTMDYWEEVDSVRRALEGWAKLAEKHNVKVCYHTHSNRCMGLNAGMLAHLVRGFDPAHIGAYLDAGHLVAEGEEFVVAVAIVRSHLSMVALKDFLLYRQEKAGHGSVKRDVVEAGTGMVDWSAVFEELVRIGFDGPLSIHCEFDVPEGEFSTAAAREVAFFLRLREQAGAA